MKKLFLLILTIFVGSISAQWYNLQWPPTATINEGDSVNVYGQIWVDGVTSNPGQGTGITAWFGVYDQDTDPSTWPESAWKEAAFNGDVGNNDEYTTAIGSELSGGTYYYASRYFYVDAAVYWYGGTGGPWNNDNGVLTVNALPTIGWANLQWPPEATVQVGDSVDVYAQVWMDGVTTGEGQGTGIVAWIGVNDENTNPSTWPEYSWQLASYNGDVGNNDEYTEAIGNNLSAGTYYYVSRFLYEPPTSIKSNSISADPNYYYGGFQGGAWDSVNNVAGVLTVNAAPDTVIDFANLQWPPEVHLVDQLAFNAYGQVYEAGVTDSEGQGEGIEAWFGLYIENTDPSTWPESIWQTAEYNVDVGNNDEYIATLNIRDILSNLEGSIIQTNKFYYSVRYRLNGGEYFYGGFQGGFWNGESNVNGEGTFEFSDFSAVGWCNLQWPPQIELNQGETETVYAQMWISGITEEEGPTPNVNAYIGVYDENTDPANWPEEAWIPADFNVDVGNNDEYMAEIGEGLEPGTYYYASRFVPGGIKSFYGGYNESGGGFWNGTENVSGILTIKSNEGPSVDWCNLQWPPEGVIEVGDDYTVYAQAWIDGITYTEGQTDGLKAWIGVSTENTNPTEWDESVWHQADFNVDAGNNDEFWLNIGPLLEQGTFYYASRFQFLGGQYSYGGYNEEGGGFWNGYSNVSGIVIVDPILSVDEETIPTVYSLDQNYPNPFNPSTTIRFAVPMQSSVKVKIYDVMGQEVAELNNGILETGIHELNWNAESLSSGIYFLRIQATATDRSDQFIDMKKMILMK